MKKLLLILFVTLFTIPAMAQWVKLSTVSNTDINAVFFLNADTGFVAGDNYGYSSGIYKTTDGGITWTTLYSTDSGIDVEFKAISFTSYNNGVAVGDSGGSALLKYTTDAGMTWNNIGSFPSTSSFDDLTFVNSTDGFVTGGDLGYYGYKTTDGGATWNSLDTSSTPYDFFTSLTFLDPNTGYIAGGTYSLTKTTDAGASWNVVPSVPASSFFSSRLVFPSANNAVLMGQDITNGNEIMRSTDGLATWKVISLGLPNDYNSLSSIGYSDPQNVYIIGDSTGLGVPFILHSSDSGSTWNYMTIPVSSGYVNSIFFVGNSVGYVGGDSGLVLKLTLAASVPKTFNAQKDFVVYPNPANTYVNWKTNIGNISNDIDVSLYDIAGRLIATVPFNTGTINIADLPSGSYILRCQNVSRLLQKE